MPGEEVYLTAMQDRLRTLSEQEDVARRRNDRARVDELQAQIDQLDADYDNALHAAALF